MACTPLQPDETTVTTLEPAGTSTPLPPGEIMDESAAFALEALQSLLCSQEDCTPLQHAPSQASVDTVGSPLTEDVACSNPMAPDGLCPEPLAGTLAETELISLEPSSALQEASSVTAPATGPRSTAIVN